MKGIEHILGELSQAMRSLPQDSEVVKCDCSNHSIQYLLHVHRYLSKLVYLLCNSLGLFSSQGKIHNIIFNFNFYFLMAFIFCSVSFSDAFCAA